jgi:hypothetical protein
MIIINRGSIDFGNKSNITVSSELYTNAGPFIVGYNVIGATIDQFLFNGTATKFTPDASGTLGNGYAYLIDNDYPGVPGINTIRMAVYSNETIDPGNLLAYSTTDKSPIGTYSWVTFDSFTENVAGGLNVTAGTPIWIALWTNVPGIIRTTSDTGESSELDLAATYPTWPATWTSAALSSIKMSVYFEATP